jgi:hypothetical protein
MRRIVLASFVAALGSCVIAPSRYNVVQPGLGCDRATRVAYRTLESLGYTVTDLVPANPAQAGAISGSRVDPEGATRAVRVVIRCDAKGAVLQPVEEDVFPTYEFSRLFGYSFTALVQRPDVETPRAGKGLEVQVRVIRSHEAVLDLGAEATQGTTLLVRVTVRNQTARAVALDPARLELVPAEGESVAPLAGPALAAALAPGPGGERVRAEQLREGRIAPGATAMGYLLYPLGVYREARVSIEDVETGETEGFVTPVQ